MKKRSYMFKEQFSVTSEYTRGTVHNLYGKVVISVAPASSFSFRSKAVWPHENYESAIREGIEDALKAAGLDLGIGAKFVLEEIGWRDTESFWDSYYEAAKTATVKILQKIEQASEKNGAD